jgi:hypothetical protein
MLEHLFLASFSDLVLCLWVRPGDYPRVEHLKGASLGWTPAFPANIRLGWKSLPGTNAQTYYENSKLTAIISFITLAQDVKNGKKSFIALNPGANVIKPFLSVAYGFS